MTGLFLQKAVSLCFTWMFIAAFWWTSATSFTPSFQIYAKNGRPIDKPRTEYILDPENSVRIGYEPRPDVRIGFDSKHGFGIAIDF